MKAIFIALLFIPVSLIGREPGGSEQIPVYILIDPSEPNPMENALENNLSQKKHKKQIERAYNITKPHANQLYKTLLAADPEKYENAFKQKPTFGRLRQLPAIITEKALLRNVIAYIYALRKKISPEYTKAYNPLDKWHLLPLPGDEKSNQLENSRFVLLIPDESKDSFMSKNVDWKNSEPLQKFDDIDKINFISLFSQIVQLYKSIKDEKNESQKDIYFLMLIDELSRFPFKEEDTSINLKAALSVFVPNQDVEKNPEAMPSDLRQWLFFIHGHGLRNMLYMDEQINLAGLKLEDFQYLLSILNNKLTVKIATLLTCYGGGVNLAVVRKRFNEDNKRALSTIKFPMFILGAHDEAVTFSAFSPLKIFEAMESYANGDKNAQQMVHNALNVEGLLKDGRPQPIQLALPQGIFVENSDQVFNIGKVLTKKLELEQKELSIPSNAQVVLVSPSLIKIPLLVTSYPADYQSLSSPRQKEYKLHIKLADEKVAFPQFISMTKLSQNHFYKKIDTKGGSVLRFILDAFARAYEHDKPNQTILIESLTGTWDITDQLFSHQPNVGDPVTLKKVIIEAYTGLNNPNIRFIVENKEGIEEAILLRPYSSTTSMLYSSSSLRAVNNIFSKYKKAIIYFSINPIFHHMQTLRDNLIDLEDEDLDLISDDETLDQSSILEVLKKKIDAAHTSKEQGK
jgi:hypothetical protein